MPINFLFDILAPVYDKVFKEPSQEELIQLLDLPIDGWMLDAGGGTGRVSNQIRSFVKNLVIGDLSRPMLARAKDKSDCCFIQTSANHLPFSNNFFERILVVDALHHFNDQQSVIKELLRVLTPGGRLVIQEPDIHKFAVKVVALIEKLALMGSHFHTWQEIQQMVANNGYRPTVHLDGQHSAWIIVIK